ncbi:MAG: hypothetical protein ABJE47_24680 [bacterium]
MTLTLQLFDFAYTIAPFRFESIVWRYASVGGAANSVGNLFLLILLVYAVALSFVDGRMILAVGVIAATIAVFLYVGTGSFLLDALQLRARIDPAGVRKFDIATAQAFAKLVTEAIVATIFAINAFRANGAARRDSLRDERTSDAPILARATPLRAP